MAACMWYARNSLLRTAMKTSWQKKEIDDKKFRAEGENNHAKIEAKSLQEGKLKDKLAA